MRLHPVVATAALVCCGAIPAYGQASARALSGIVVDSLGGAAVAGARVSVENTSLGATADPRGRFTITGITPGDVMLIVRTASLDSMKAMHRMAITVGDSTPLVRVRVPSASQVTAAFCSDRSLVLPGVVYGSVDISGETTPPRNVRVVAEWADTAAHSADARTNSQGIYRLCGVPLSTPLQVRAVVANTNAAPFPVQVPPIGRMVRADLTLDRQVDVAAVFTGVVMVDSTRSPIAGAEVTLPDLAKTAVTNALGAFRIADVPTGDHEVVVRRVGYAPITTRIVFSGQDVDRRILLDRVVTLDSVVTKAVAGVMTEFEENRKTGLGHFLTRHDLEKVGAAKLGDALAAIPGLGVVRGRSSGAWVMSKRRPPSLSSTRSQPSCKDLRRIDECRAADPVNYTPDYTEASQGIIKACYSLVYVDGVLMNRGKPTEPFDVNSILPEQIEGIEYYASAAQTPMRYSTLNSSCGVLVIHTRRGG